MALADFIKKRFLGQKVCFSVNNGESNQVLYAELWHCDREHFEGIVKEVEDDVIVLEIDGNAVYINSAEISYFWVGPFNPHKKLKTTAQGNKK